MRQIDVRTTIERDGETEIHEIFTLGHWEVMQIALALDALADTLKTGRDADVRLHTRNLARVFQGDNTFTITRTRFG